jgi:hypothetical protein
MASAAKMFNLLISPWPELGVAWQSALDRYGVSNSRLLLWLLWSTPMPTKGRGAMKGVLTDGLHISLRDANAVRVVDESTVRGMTVRAYVLTVICARLNVAYVEPKRCGPVRSMGSKRPLPPPRKVKVSVRNGRDATPTQPRGGPYWPNPGRRGTAASISATRDESRAVG